jgi:transposase
MKTFRRLCYWAIPAHSATSNSGVSSKGDGTENVWFADLQAIHRVRDRLVSRRTALINQLRAFLLKRGMVFAQKPANLKAAMADILENAEADLRPQMRNLIDILGNEWKLVEQQIGDLNAVGHPS